MCAKKMEIEGRIFTHENQMIDTYCSIKKLVKRPIWKCMKVFINGNISFMLGQQVVKTKFWFDDLENYRSIVKANGE